MKRMLPICIVTILALAVVTAAAQSRSGRRDRRESPTTQSASDSTTTAPHSTAPASASAISPSAPHRDWSAYEVVYQRNIFTKRGDLAATTRPRSEGVMTPTVRIAAPSNVWVVTGVVIVDGERAALFENTQSGAVIRAKIGQNIADGKITAIEAEGVSIDFGTGAQRIAVGSQTDGRDAPAAMPTAGATSVAPSSSSSGDGATMSASEAALLERMRARRAQEK